MKLLSDSSLPDAEIGLFLHRNPFGGTHAGLLFRENPSLPYHIVHQAWHEMTLVRDLSRYLNSQPGLKVLWLCPGLTVGEINSLMLHAYTLASRIDAGNLSFPYSFSGLHAKLDKNRAYALVNPTGCGLSCATFILALFAAANVGLLDGKTWETDRSQARIDKDIEVNTSLHNAFLAWINDPSENRSSEEIYLLSRHAEEMQKEINSVRVRPEEVCAASMMASSERPVAFAEAEVRGSELLRLI